MSDKLDDLFSPDRLRSHWDRERAKEPEPEAPTPRGVELAHRLRSLAAQRFSGAPGAALGQLIERLGALAQRRFAPDPAAPAEALEPLDAEIELLLDQIEDLSEALTIGGGRQQGA